MSLERFYNPVIRPFSLNITNLPGAKLYFYQSGSSTPKPVYQDKFGNVPHSNPVVADSSGSFAPIFLSGLYRVTLTDADDVVQTPYPIDNIGNDSDNAVFGPWSETYNYAINDIVYGSNNKWYKSITADNLGNDPTTSPEEWTEIPFFGFYNEFETYDEDAVAFYENRIWISLQDDNTGNTPATGSSWWVSTTGGTAAERDVKDAGESYSSTDIPSAGLTSEIIRNQQADKGRWEDQTGQAVPPYLVDYGAGSNYALWAEDLSNAVYGKTRLETVVDSGIAAPTINGQSFGNFWTLTPNTSTGVHTIRQALSLAIPNGRGSFIVRPNGYSNISLQFDDGSFSQLPSPRPTVNIDLSTGATSGAGGGLSNVDVTPLVDGSFLVDAGWYDKTDLQSMTIYILDGSSFSYSGNSADGILATRVQVALPGARYAKTTTADVPYTPPEIYALRKPQTDVKAVTPGTDDDIWELLGAGGGITYIGTQTYTSADEDGSDNIAIDVDFSDKNWVDINVSDASISTSGAFELDIAGLQTDKPETYVIHFKGAAIKSSVTYALPAGWSADWHATPAYKGAGGSDATKRAGHTYITIQTDPLAGQNANFSLGDARAY